MRLRSISNSVEPMRPGTCTPTRAGLAMPAGSVAAMVKKPPGISCASRRSERSCLKTCSNTPKVSASFL